MVFMLANWCALAQQFKPPTIQKTAKRSVAKSAASEGQDPFDYQGLQYAVVDGGVEVVGCYESFENLVIPERVELDGEEYQVVGIGDEAFLFNEEIRSVSIPSSVKRIGVQSFSYTLLQSIEIPLSVTHIDYGAFYCCPLLTSISIPASVEFIGFWAFSGCNSLTSVVFEDGENPLETYVNEEDIIGSSGISRLYLGRNIVGGSYINGSTFKEITLGQYVTDATALRFPESGDLQMLVCLATEPPIVGEFTEEQYQSVTVTVPEGSLDAYRSADVWMNFYNMEEAVGDLKVILDTTRATMAEGEQRTLVATIIPMSDDLTVTWTSSNESVAKGLRYGDGIGRGYDYGYHYRWLWPNGQRKLPYRG